MREIKIPNKYKSVPYCFGAFTITKLHMYNSLGNCHKIELKKKIIGNLWKTIFKNMKTKLKSFCEIYTMEPIGREKMMN